MNPSIDIEKLTPEERLELIEQLWESLTDTPDKIALTPAQEAELDRRLDEIDAGDVRGIPWEEVARRIREGR